MKPKRSILFSDRLPICIFLFAFLSICIAKMILIQTRYVDADEFTHLHWSYLLFTGSVPYRDFFFHFTPVFHLLFFPLFLFTPRPDIIVMARYIILLFFVGTAYLLFSITGRYTKNRLSPYIAVLVFLVFPMTFDRTIEVRPDIIMTCLSFAAGACLLDKKKISGLRTFMSGILFGLSMAVLLKTVAVIPAFLVLLTRKNIRQTVKNYLLFGLGSLLPIAVIAAYLERTGTLAIGITSLIQGSVAVKSGEGTFSPLLALSPWPFIYTIKGGWSIPWIVNSVCIIAGLGGILLAIRKNRQIAIGMFFWIAGSVVTLFLFPTPYTQYFILPSVAIAIGCGLLEDVIVIPSENTQRVFHYLGISVVLLFCCGSFLQQYQERHMADQNNKEQFQVIRDILAISTPDESVYDMTGSYIFRPDGFYICCNTYSTLVTTLPWKIPTLASSLRQTKTKFIILDRRGLSLWLPTPTDLSFMLAHYVQSSYPKIYTAGSTFLCDHSVCRQTDIDGRSVSEKQQMDIIFPDRYTVTTVPHGQSVMIGRTAYQDGVTAWMPIGVYPVSAPPDITSVTIRLAR